MNKIVTGAIFVLFMVSSAVLICNDASARGNLQGALESEEEIPKAAEEALETASQQGAAAQGNGAITWANSEPSSDPANADSGN